MTHKTKLILIGLVVLFFCSFNLYGAEYKLKWDAVSGDVTGYKINYGTSVGNYTNTKDVGKVTEYALSNLPLSVGTTYYFVVRAYNATCESEDSDYVTYKVTAVSDTTPPLNPQGATAVIQGDGIRISWQAVTAQDLSGYKVYYGVESRNYSPSVPVGNVTGYSLGGLEKGRKYYVAVTAVDTSENESGFSPETSIEIPAAIDTPPVINIASPVSSGSYTATNATISVSGTATDDKGISQVKWANSLGGIGTAIGTSNWSGSITLKDGTNVVTVTAYDTAGKTAGASIQIIYKTPDSIKPVIALASPTTGAAYSTTNSSVNVTGTATDNVSVSKVTWANSATGINGTATGTSNWSVSNVSLIAGTNAITITASDGASNTGSVTLNVIYSPADTEKPIVKLVSPTTNSSYTQNQTVINLSGTATDNTAVSKVTWANSASGESGIASGTNTWSISNVPLKPGMNAVTITASDISGNMGSVILNVTCNAADTTKPVVKIVLPTTATSYTANQALVNLSGTATDNIGISQVTWLNSTSGQSGTATGTDNWSVGNVSLVSGSNPIIITAYDATGNTGSVTLNVTRNILTTLIDTTDTAKPVITLSSPTTGTSYTANQASINLSGTATDNIGISKVTWSNSSSGQSGTATGTDNWSVGNVSLVSGSNPIIITAYDATGNTGSVTLNVTRNILTTLIDTTDTAKPVITLGSPTTGTSYTANQASINLSGTATDNIGISKVTWSNSSSGKSGTATGTNTWSVGNVSLETGINPITLTAHDNAGNMGSITLTVTYEALDTEKPVVALVSPTTGTSYTVNQASVNLSGTAKDNIGVSKVVWSNSATGGSGTATGTANWSTGNIILAQGTNPILVNAYDTAENVGSYTINVTYNSGTSNDAVNPSISLSMPVTGTAYSTSSTPLTLSGKASDNVGVVKVTWVNSRGGSGNASGTSDWSIGTIDLKEGNNIISITAQDAMGNIASHTLAVTYTLPDTIKPVISLVSPTTGTTFDATVSRMNLAGTATDNIGVSRVTWTSTTGGFGTANGTTNWSIDGIELQLGLNTIIVTAFDAADNKSIHSLTVNYEPPKLTGVDEGSPDTGDPSDTPTIEKSKTDSVQPKEEQKTKARSRNRFLRLFGIGL